MDFSSAINSKMKDVADGSTEPFIIYRDQSGEWHCDYTQNQYGDGFDWVEDAIEQDPFFGEYTGEDFSCGSFPTVYDKVLVDRIHAEFDYNMESGMYDGNSIEAFIEGMDREEAQALVSFFDENAGSFSQKVTDYLTMVERPFTALCEMCPLNMTADNEGWDFNEDLAQDAISCIENAVYDRLHVSDGKSEPVKRLIDGYLEKHFIRLAGRDVIFAEKPEAEAPYLVCFAKSDNSLGLVEYYDIQYAADFVEAMWIFNNYQAALLYELKNERAENGLPIQKLTADDCLPDSYDKDWKDSLLIVKPDILAPEYRSAEHQLALCTGGFGANPNARGRAVFVKELHSGKQMRYERYQIAGIADHDKLPEWAVKKLALWEAIKEPGVFEYGGYHFKPYRQFRKGEVKRRLAGDSRPWKTDVQYEMRNMRSDHELGLSRYDWKKAEYSHGGFYAASGNNDADIFKCVENGRLYVPYDNELFQYSEPPVKTKKTDKKPSLLGRLDDAKAEADAYNAERKDVPKTKKRGDMEVD